MFSRAVGSVSHDSGVSPGTISNWFKGKTMRPQFATTAAVVRSMGYDFVLTPINKEASHDAHTVATIIKRFPSVKDRVA
jgi:hypothetical protein